MNIRALKLLTDENVSPRLVSFLRGKGIDVKDVKELGLQGKDDRYLMELASREKRFLLSYDSDIGTLAINEGEPCFGILYLRPKDLRVDNVIQVFERFMMVDIDIEEGMLIVIDESKARIRSIKGLE